MAIAAAADPCLGPSTKNRAPASGFGPGAVGSISGLEGSRAAPYGSPHCARRAACPRTLSALAALSPGTASTDTAASAAADTNQRPGCIRPGDTRTPSAIPLVRLAREVAAELLAGVLRQRNREPRVEHAGGLPGAARAARVVAAARDAGPQEAVEVLEC